MAEEQAKLIDERLATKEDIEGVHARIEALRLATQKDIAEINGNIKNTANETKAEILKWILGTIGGQTILLLATMITLMRTGMH